MAKTLMNNSKSVQMEPTLEQMSMARKMDSIKDSIEGSEYRSREEYEASVNSIAQNLAKDEKSTLKEFLDTYDNDDSIAILNDNGATDEISMLSTVRNRYEESQESLHKVASSEAVMRDPGLKVPGMEHVYEKLHPAYQKVDAEGDFSGDTLAIVNPQSKAIDMSKYENISRFANEPESQQNDCMQLDG